MTCRFMAFCNLNIVTNLSPSIPNKASAGQVHLQIVLLCRKFGLTKLRSLSPIVTFVVRTFDKLSYYSSSVRISLEKCVCNTNQSNCKCCVAKLFRFSFYFLGLEFHIYIFSLDLFISLHAFDSSLDISLYFFVIACKFFGYSLPWFFFFCATCRNLSLPPSMLCSPLFFTPRFLGFFVIRVAMLQTV